MYTKSVERFQSMYVSITVSMIMLYSKCQVYTRPIPV